MFSGLVLALVAESVHTGKSVNTGARGGLKAETVNLRKDALQRITDTPGLTLNLHQDHGRDPGKEGKTKQDRNNPLPPPDTRGS